MVEANELIDVVLVDTALAARLEQTEGLANARFVEARIRQSSESKAAWIQVRVIAGDEAEQWAQTSARGWSEHPEVIEMILGFGRTFASTVGATGMQAEIDCQPIATGVVFIADSVALLAGASTIPNARRQGAQSLLLEARLRYAVEQGCDLAMMCALPGSPSQRNAQRNGFQIAYTRTKWKLMD